MVPIVLASDKAFDENCFTEYLLGICRDHKEQNRALAFAFLVYDFDNYTIKQIIEDKNYWTALDKISGKYLSIFYLNSKDSYYRNRQKEIYQEELAAKQRALAKGYMQMMRQITIQATPLEKSISYLKIEFGLDENLKHPFVLFFQSDGEVIHDCFAVGLRQEKLEDAFLELKRQIENAVGAVAKVTPDNFENHVEIFNLIKSSVKGGNFTYFVKRKMISKFDLGTVISFIKTLVGA